MKIVLKNTAAADLKTDLLIVPVSPRSGGKERKAKSSPFDAFSPESAALLRVLDSRLERRISRLLARSEYKPGNAKRIEVLVESEGIEHVRLSGLSAADEKKPPALDEWRRLGGDARQSAKRAKAKRVSVVLSALEVEHLADVIGAVTEGLLLAGYEFKRYKSAPKAKKDTAPALTAELIISRRPTEALTRAIARASRYAESVAYARDLVNTPPNDMKPATLLAQARKISGMRRSQIKLRAFNRRALEKMKAFSLLSVARGSSAEPYLLHLTYRPKKRSKSLKRLVFVGKGITFDSGGLSIKTGKGMEDMKCDMAGAACVLAVMRALATLPPAMLPAHEIHVIIPTAENMINGESMRPGDVISAMNGKTIEVLNTDAEGRLILADALVYASRLKPDYVLDLATLTGACVVALGSEYAGMFSTEPAFTELVSAASQAGGERLWSLPLATEYRSQMESDVADIKNIGNGGPGAIIGALFLKEFAPAGVPWIHLDIAGPAFVAKGNEYLRRGGSGFGVLTLLRLLEKI